VTTAGFPLQDGAPCQGLHVRRWGVGFVHCSRAIFVALCQTLALKRVKGGCGQYVFYSAAMTDQDEYDHDEFK
jgi:hypothetical protein